MSIGTTLGSISVWTGRGLDDCTLRSTEEFEGMSVWAWTAICAELKAINANEAKLSRADRPQAKETPGSGPEVLRMEADLDNSRNTGDGLS